MNNDFLKALTYEKEQFPRADEFYRRVLNGPMNKIKITRWDYQLNDVHRRMQDDGIDVTIENELATNEYDRRVIGISEKFRTSDFGDMFIELYSKFPNVIGWGLKEKADLVAYFTPWHTYIIDNDQLKKVIQAISDKLDAEALAEGLKEARCFQYIYKDKIMEVRKVPTHHNGKVAWEGVGVCIKWQDLQDLGVTIAKYDRYERKNLFGQH